MTLICLLIVLALEFHFKIGSEYRQFGWFIKFRNYLAETFAARDFFESWAGIAIILLTPVLVIYGIVNIFEGTLYWLVTFVVSLLILFLCLGPKPLESSFKDYFAAMERNDQEAAFLHISKINGFERPDDIPETDELVRSATRAILVQSQKRYFGVLAWFIFLGPIGALFYRLAHLYRDECAQEEFDEHLPLMDQLIHWVEWLPARLSSLLFLLTGDFVHGLYRIQDYLTDADADNDQLVSETGIAALGLEMGQSTGNVEENQRALSMVRRTVIFYLVVGAIVSSLT